MKRPSIWVRDEFSASIYPPFSFILTLTGAVKWWFSRALQRSFQEMSTNDRWKNIAFDFINAPIALVNNYWATLGNILWFFLPKNQRYCFFWSHVLCDLVFHRWKERVAWKLVPSFVPKVQKMWKTACYRESRRSRLLYSSLYTIWVSYFFRNKPTAFSFLHCPVQWQQLTFVLY